MRDVDLTQRRFMSTFRRHIATMPGDLRHEKAVVSPLVQTQVHHDLDRGSPAGVDTSVVVRVLLSILAICATYLGYNWTRSATSSALEVGTRFNHYSSPPGWEDARQEVITAIKESYRSYATSEAWGCDDYFPETGKGGNLTTGGSVGYFIVDVLDTLLLTPGMEEDARKAKEYIMNDLSFEVDGDLNAFEITIRLLGGLLSAYHLDNKDKIYLDKAKDLGDRLLPIFDTPTGIPLSFINLKTKVATADKDNSGASSLAEATTLQLEFKYLAEITGEQKYWNAAEKVMMAIRRAPSLDGLLPILVSPTTGQVFFHIRLGSRGDSYYEYLLKQYLQTDRTEVVYREMYDKAMHGIKEHLVKETSRGFVHTGELQPRRNSDQSVGWSYVPKQDHLVCFLGGSLLLGVTEGQGVLTSLQISELEEERSEDWMIGTELIKSCVDTYQGTETGLAPEIVHFRDSSSKIWTQDRDWIIPSFDLQKPTIDARNILRPETVESLFLAWRATHDPIYREWGWQIFKAFQTHCRLPHNGAYTSIQDVRRVPPVRENRMESFWLSETLKYLLLLFSDDDIVPLDKYVLNTEAHILPIFKPTVVDTNNRIYQ